MRIICFRCIETFTAPNAHICSREFFNNFFINESSSAKVLLKLRMHDSAIFETMDLACQNMSIMSKVGRRCHFSTSLRPKRRLLTRF